MFAIHKRLIIEQRVKKYREANGLTQDRFAFMVWLSRPYINGIERGERNGGIDNLIKISEGLNVPLEQLFHDM